MNTLNEKLYGTIMKFNPKQEILYFYDKIKCTKKINKLDELYNMVSLSNLDNETVSMLKGIIELQAENIKLKEYNKVS